MPGIPDLAQMAASAEPMVQINTPEGPKTVPIRVANVMLLGEIASACQAIQATTLAILQTMESERSEEAARKEARMKDLEPDWTPVGLAEDDFLD